MNIPANFGNTLDELQASSKQLQSALSKCQAAIEEAKKRMSNKEEIEALYVDSYYKNKKNREVIYINGYDEVSGKLTGIRYVVDYNTCGNQTLVMDTNFKINPSSLHKNAYPGWTEITPDYFFELVRQYSYTCRTGCYGYTSYRVQ